MLLAPSAQTVSTHAADQTDDLRTGQFPAKSPAAHLQNLIRVHQRVLTGGLPESEAAFTELKALGVQTVISVDGATPDVETAEQAGLTYVHLPHGYDSIPKQRILELAKAIIEFDGLVYVHCHHGKHRAPAAAASACVAAGYASTADANTVLDLAGTDPRYSGLYRSVAGTTPVPIDQLAAMRVDYVAQATVPALVEGMIDLERTFDRLRRLAKNDWKQGSERAATEPAHEALLLKEHFAELQRLDSHRAQPESFHQAMTESTDLSNRLVEALAVASSESRDDDTTTKPDRLLNQIGSRCVSCHRTHRDRSGGFE